MKTEEERASTSSSRQVFLAAVVSHPIQYYTHRYRQIAGMPGVRLKVLFGARMGVEPYYDKEFGRTIAWDRPLLEGYEHAFADDARAGGVGRALESFGPDGVWIHGYSEACTRAAWRWAMRRRKPVYLSGDSNIRKERRKPAGLRLAKQCLLRPFLATFAGMLSVGEANEAWYRYYGVPARKMIRMPFTVDPAVFGPAWRHRGDRRDRLRKRLGIPADAVTALWCGKITALKRPLDFVEALKAVRASGGPPVWALFAGDGALREAVAQRCREMGLPAAFTGFLNAGEVPDAYAAADFLVHTCQRESYGLVAVEAASMGLPLIVPASMGAVGETDAAQPGRNALVYSDNRLSELAHSIRELATNRMRRRRMSRYAQLIYSALLGRYNHGARSLVSCLQNNLATRGRSRI